MNRLICFLILMIACSAVGQDTPKLIDEFEHRNCEDTKARVDNLMIAVNANPNSQAVIVINPEQGNLLKSVIYEEMLRGSLLVRRYDTARVRFVRSKPTIKPGVRMWMVSNDVIWEPDDRVAWELSFNPGSKAFMVQQEWYYDDDICPPVDGVRILAELLKANPHGRTNIVARPGSRFRSSRARRAFLRDASEKYAVNASRVRFFFTKRLKNRSTLDEADTEFWFVP